MASFAGRDNRIVAIVRHGSRSSIDWVLIRCSLCRTFEATAAANKNSTAPGLTYAIN